MASEAEKVERAEEGEEVEATFAEAFPERIDGKPCWERLATESGKAFHAFQHFRDQGPRRTLEETARFVLATMLVERHRRQQDLCRVLGREVPEDLTPELLEREALGGERRNMAARVNRWSKEHHWHPRAYHYDTHLDRLATRSQENEVREMAKRHIALSGMMQNLAARRLHSMQPEDLKPKDVAAFVEKGVKVERLSRDLPTDAASVRAHVPAKDAVEEIEAATGAIPLNAAREVLLARITERKKRTEAASRLLGAGEVVEDVAWEDV